MTLSCEVRWSQGWFWELHIELSLASINLLKQWDSFLTVSQQQSSEVFKHWACICSFRAELYYSWNKALSQGTAEMWLIVLLCCNTSKGWPTTMLNEIGIITFSKEQKEKCRRDWRKCERLEGSLSFTHMHTQILLVWLFGFQLVILFTWQSPRLAIPISPDNSCAHASMKAEPMLKPLQGQQRAAQRGNDCVIWAGHR